MSIVIFKQNLKKLGINQTIHRVYLKINCTICVNSIITHEPKEVETHVMIAETVIIGEVPEAYYNLEGVKEISVDDSLNLM